MEHQPTYRERMDDAHQRLARALAPATDQQHAIVNWLRMWDLPTLETLALLVEQAIRTRARAHGMRVAEFAEANMVPSPAAAPDVLNTLAHIASLDDVELSNALDSKRARDATASAYDRGWAEGIAHAREQQLAGLDPELWPDR